jgi:hypothetical protein
MDNTPGIYNVSVAASFGGNCSAGPNSLSVADTVFSNLPATPGLVSGDVSVCPYATGELYGVAPVTNATSYSWTLPSDASIAAVQNNDTINVNFGMQNGNICVSASNACGASASNCLSVTMQTPSGSAPTISSQPVSLSLTQNDVGSNQTFSISASGSGLSYQWQISTDNGNSFVNLSNSGSYSNVNTATLNLNGVTTSLCSNQYRCVVGPCPTSISSAATISFYVPGSQVFGYTGSLQSFTIPTCVNSITIESFGAQGGNHSENYCCPSNPSYGGLGADIKGTFTVTPGAIVNIIVGQQGQDDGGWSNPWNGGAGGGGGSFVYDANSNLMIAAGGGGGAALIDDGNYQATGVDAQSSNCAAASKSCFSGGCGGADGNGNLAGKGWNSVLSNPSGNGWGGYGGGGGDSGFGPQYHGAGGGGGYSGGGGATWGMCSGYGDGGGGGGSYNNGTNQMNNTSVQSGNGQIIITW